MDLMSPPVERRVKKRFSSTRYIFSKAGVPKIISIVLYLISGILYLTGSGSPCTSAGGSTSQPPDLLFPLLAVASAALSVLVYAVFATGCAKRALSVWVRLDVFLSILLAIANLIVAVLVLTQCSPVNPVEGVPAPLSLVASALLVICAAATYYMWRNRPEETDSLRGGSGASGPSWRIPRLGRGSVFTLEVEKNAFEL